MTIWNLDRGQELKSERTYRYNMTDPTFSLHEDWEAGGFD
jgi:hypothetical protein